MTILRLIIAQGTQFQFHKGTIRTKAASSWGLKSTLFQFHKGTIRT